MSLVQYYTPSLALTNKIVARKALPTFSTPGFGNKQAPCRITRERSDAISISSDDTAPSLKRDSSSYSVLEDTPAPSSKRLRTEKVNILGASTRVNQQSSTSGYSKDDPVAEVMAAINALIDTHKLGEVHFPQGICPTQK